MSAAPSGKPSSNPAACQLKNLERTAGVLFRALGGERELRVVASNRNHAVRIGDTLRLPMEFAPFASKSLNRELYLWLIALAASDAQLLPKKSHAEFQTKSHEIQPPYSAWLSRNRNATAHALARLPGLAKRYKRLCAALLALRPTPETLEGEEAAVEIALRHALNIGTDISAYTISTELDHIEALPLFPLWLYPPAARTAATSGPNAPTTKPKPHKDALDPSPNKPAPKILATAKSTKQEAEFVKREEHQADTASQQREEKRNPQALGKDGSVQDGPRYFDQELPISGHDDIVIADGIPLPEWDYRNRILRPDHCFVQEIAGRHSGGEPLPEHLRKHAQRLRQQFASLVPLRHWLRAQPDGTEPDIEAYVRATADRLAGSATPSQGLYLVQQQRERDLACLVLADLSLSTDVWVSHNQRVIDVIRDSLLLFAEALSATGDRFGLYGFSSHKREQVRFHRFKDFLAPYDPVARGRIAGIRPGHYTRMGAAIRHASNVLEAQSASLRLLLILSDGRPHDVDYYEERYGIEDTRMALIEARRKRIRPFCITIDREGSHYLPHLFGVNGYTVLRRPEELSERLPLLYAQITEH